MARKKEYQEDLVVEKAMHTFWANGFENTSLRMLEKDMGINQFSIYSSFGSKQRLFIEVLKKYKGFVKEFFIKDLLQSKGHLCDLRRFLLEYGHGIQSGQNPYGCLMMNTGMEASEKDPDIVFELSSHFDYLKDAFYILFEKIKFNEELPAQFDSNKYASYLLASIQGLSLFAKFHSQKEVDDYIDTVMGSFI